MKCSLADKRLDEWVEIDRIDVVKGEILPKSEAEQTNEPSERKMTRNQKRKSELASNVFCLFCQRTHFEIRFINLIFVRT